ncbi:hypothetical protein OMR07_10565 [Methylobacterium organophilum]|nr:hypothetical protein [Methylobacterium organophilum]
MPNAQQTIDSTASFYLNQGVLGATIILLLILLCVLCLVIRYLYKSQETKTERIIVAMEAANDAAEASKKSQDELKGLFETIVKTVGEQGHQNQILAEKVQHGFGNTAASLQAVANELDRIRDRLSPGRA